MFYCKELTINKINIYIYIYMMILKKQSGGSKGSYKLTRKSFEDRKNNKPYSRKSQPLQNITSRFTNKSRTNNAVSRIDEQSELLQKRLTDKINEITLLTFDRIDYKKFMGNMKTLASLYVLYYDINKMLDEIYKIDRRLIHNLKRMFTQIDDTINNTEEKFKNNMTIFPIDILNAVAAHFDINLQIASKKKGENTTYSNFFNAIVHYYYLIHYSLLTRVIPLGNPIYLLDTENLMVPILQNQVIPRNVLYRKLLAKLNLFIDEEQRTISDPNKRHIFILINHRDNGDNYNFFDKINENIYYVNTKCGSCETDDFILIMLYKIINGEYKKSLNRNTLSITRTSSRTTYIPKTSSDKRCKIISSDNYNWTTITLPSSLYFTDDTKLEISNDQFEGKLFI
jgi:hypothetical protein